MSPIILTPSLCLAFLLASVSSFTTGEIETYTVSLHHPWKNPLWLLALASKDNIIGSCVVQAIKIVMVLPDALMFRDEEKDFKVMASLLPKGDGMDVRCPSMLSSHFMEGCIRWMHAQDSDNPDDPSALLSHLKLATAFIQKEGKEYV